MYWSTYQHKQSSFIKLLKSFIRIFKKWQLFLDSWSLLTSLFLTSMVLCHSHILFLQFQNIPLFYFWLTKILHTFYYFLHFFMLSYFGSILFSIQCMFCTTYCMLLHGQLQANTLFLSPCQQWRNDNQLQNKLIGILPDLFLFLYKYWSINIYFQQKGLLFNLIFNRFLKIGCWWKTMLLAFTMNLRIYIWLMVDLQSVIKNVQDGA